MANTLRHSHDCQAVRGCEVKLATDIRSALKDALIDLARDQQRPLKEVVADALTVYARDNWMREEACA